MESELKVIPPQLTDDRSELAPDDIPLLKADRQNHGTRSEVQVSSDTIEEMEKKCAAYVRHDVYGRMGREELPLVEKLLLGLALVFLVPIRVVAGTIVLVIYYAICRVCTAFLAPNTEGEQEDFAHMGGWRRAVIVQSGRFLARCMLFVFGFYWITESKRVKAVGGSRLKAETASGNQLEELARPGAVISNHISYVDILYHMYSTFPSFVAKGSVAKLPLVGLISKCLGCVYVQRETKSSDFRGVSGVVNQRIREAHQNKSAPRFLLFPEGTTTNGDYLIPFKTGAFLAAAPVLPFILRYPYRRFSPAWDSISGVRHLVLLLCQFVNYLEATQLPVYQPSEEEKEDPKLYAENVRKLMAHEGNLTLSDIGLAEKWVYMAALDGNISTPTVLHQKDD